MYSAISLDQIAYKLTKPKNIILNKDYFSNGAP